tara:strand:- start:2118 stop:2903 length:786 start_codon:yes stop_codon:yes gene_type:complete
MRKDISHRIAVVTSFNNKLFDEYAKRTIATYSWPFPLYIYSEDFDGSRLMEMESLTSKTIKVRNIFELDPECRKFVDRNSYRNVDNYIYDGVRFCYKPLSLSHFILNECKYDIVIWCDADFVWTRKKITEEFVFNSLTGEDIMISYFGRNFMHSECGFLVFNLSNNITTNYLVEMRNMYVSDEIYNIEEQHDSFVWDYVRLGFEGEYGVKNKNLSSEHDMSQGHPMASSFLNVYFDHLKGDNKHRNHHPTWLQNKGVDFLQ